MVRQVLVLQLALFAGIAAANNACENQAQDGDSCIAVPPQGRALLQVVSHDAPAQQMKTPVLENYVEDELLPQAEATRQALQTEMDTIYVAVDNCSRIMHEHSVDTEAEKIAINLAEGKHRQCDVAQQKKLDDKEQKCGEVKGLLANMKVPPSLESVKSNGTFETEAVAALLLQQYDFFTELAPALGEAQEGCKVATEVLEKHGKTCEAEMADLSTAICALKHKLSDECAEYEKCYTWRLAYIKPEVEKVQKLEEHNKNEFKYRTCFGQAACDQATVDVSRLSVKYPPLPAKGSCIAGIHTKFSYPALECGPMVAATTAAPEAAAETTAAPAETASDATTAAPAEAAAAPAAAPEAIPEAVPAAPDAAATVAPVVPAAAADAAATAAPAAAPATATVAPEATAAAPAAATEAPVAAAPAAAAAAAAAGPASA